MSNPYALVVEEFVNARGPDDCRRLLESAGFAVLKTQVGDPSSLGHVALLCVQAN